MRDRQWRRQSLPSRLWFLWLAGILVLTLIGQVAWRELFLSRFHPDVAAEATAPFGLMCVSICAGGAIMLWLVRTKKFPTSRYTDWLTRTAWRPGQRLPFGPYTPIREDAVIVLVLSGIAWVTGDMNYIALAVVPMVYFAGWVVRGWGQAVTCESWYGYLCLLAVPIGIHLCQMNAELLLPTIGMGTALVGLGAILGWKSLEQQLKQLSDQSFQDASTDRNMSSIKSSIHDVLRRPSRYFSPVSWRAGILAVVPAFVILSLFPWVTESGTDDVAMIAFATVFLSAIGRLLAFLAIGSTFGLGARFGRRRFIHFAYDRIFLVPALMIAIGFISTTDAAIQTLSSRIACPLAIVVPILLGCCMGPDPNIWSLTAPMSLNRKKAASQRRSASG